MSAKKVSENSVIINPSLQKLFVVAVGILFAVQLFSAVYMLSTSPGGAPLQFWLFQASTVLLPLAFFGMAVWYVGRFGTMLNWVFKAALIALVGVLVLMAALQLSYMYSIVLRPDYGNNQWTHVPFYITCAVSVSYAIILAGLKTKRIKRG